MDKSKISQPEIKEIADRALSLPRPHRMINNKQSPLNVDLKPVCIPIT